MLSSACGPAGWSAPVVKFTSSWHEPHAFELGYVYQFAACTGFFAGSVPSWQ